MKRVFWKVFGFGILGILGACATIPKPDNNVISENQAREWLNQYCSDKLQPLDGRIVVKSKTPEFKGQYPADIHFDAQDSFVMEVTNIIGGTLLRLSRDAQGIEILAPARPQYNRKGVKDYLGLELTILTQLLHGDLPCPDEVRNREAGKRLIRVEKNLIFSESANWKWTFERAQQGDQVVPGSIHLVQVKPQVKSLIKFEIDLKIEEWDVKEHFARKVTVVTPEGELRWTWRSRELVRP